MRLAKRSGALASGASEVWTPDRGRSSSLVLFAVVLALVACGGKPAPKDAAHTDSAPAEAAPDAGAEAPAESVQDAPKSTTLPKTCAGDAAQTGPCVPDPAFVRRLCNAPFFDAALTMFARSHRSRACT